MFADVCEYVSKDSKRLNLALGASAAAGDRDVDGSMYKVHVVGNVTNSRQERTQLDTSSDVDSRSHVTLYSQLTVIAAAAASLRLLLTAVT